MYNRACRHQHSSRHSKESREPLQDAPFSESPPLNHDVIARRYGPALFELACQLTCSKVDACDLVQDTFEKSLRKMPKGLAPASAQRWLQVTLRNRFCDWCRSPERRLCKLQADTARLTIAASEFEDEPRWTKVEPTQLWHCVERLNPVLREVFLMRTRDRRSHAQIASELQIPVATVGTRCFRALRHLRRMLEDGSPASQELPG